jgi:hypothetical protein
VTCLSTAVSLLFLEVILTQISGVSLALTCPSRLCLLRVLCLMPLLQAFPFPNTLGEVTLHLHSQACMFIYSSRGKWVFPPLLWSFPPTAAFTSFPTPDCWVCAAAPAGWHVCLQLTWEVGLPPSPVEFSSPRHSQAFPLLVAECSRPLRPGPACLFTVPGPIPLPTSSISGCPTLFASCFYCSYCLLLSSLFSPGGDQSVQGSLPM